MKGAVKNKITQNRKSESWEWKQTNKTGGKRRKWVQKGRKQRKREVIENFNSSTHFFYLSYPLIWYSFTN